MGFGVSGRDDSTFMVGADATIAWVDVTTGSPNAIDYYLTGRFQVPIVMFLILSMECFTPPV